MKTLISLNNPVSRVLYPLLRERITNGDHLSSPIITDRVMRAITLLHLIGVCQATTSLQCWCALTLVSSDTTSVLNRTSAPFQPYPITRAVCYRAIHSTPLAETFLLLRTLLPLRASECRTRVIREHFPVSVSCAFDGTKLPRSLLATISSIACAMGCSDFPPLSCEQGDHPDCLVI